MRRLFGILLLIALIAAIALFALYRNLDDIILTAINEGGDRLTGTDVRAASVEIDFSELAGEIRSLTIANPPGFSNEPAIRIDRIEIVIPESPDRRLIHLSRVRMSGIVVLWEIGPEGKSNLAILRERIKRNSRSADIEEEPRMRIDRLSLAQPKARLSLVGIEAAEIAFDDIVLRNLGRDGGITPSELAIEILRAFEEQIIRRGLGNL